MDERVAFYLPQYAGIARDTGALYESGLIVWLTNVEVAPDAMLIIRRELERRHNPLPAHMRFIRVAYSYRQLRSWLECYLRGATAADLTTWTVSLLRNRVGLGVGHDSIRPKVQADIRRLGLPIEAFDIRVEIIRTGAVPQPADRDDVARQLPVLRRRAMAKIP